MKYVRKRSNEGVSPVIATILMVAITVVLAAVLYVLVSGFLTGTSATKNIGVVCTKTNATAYKCNIANADTGVDFATVNIQITDSSGTVHCTETAPVTYTSGTNTLDCGASAIVSVARATDNGNGAFGTGDDIYVTPEYVPTATSLVGLNIKLSGGGEGSAGMN
jgi:flagellin-like protein